MSSLLYPENTIWYVEASDGGGYTTCGSAVAIRLRKLDEPRSAATYLISCAHVLRGRAQDGSAGFGRLLPTVHAWPPDFAYHQDYGKKVRIDASIKPLLPPGDVPLAKRTDVADDWVVLKFEDDSDYSHTDAVREWVAHDSEGQNYRIFGFPGGKSAFSDDNIVSPTKIPDYFQVRNDSNGVLTSQGDQTRPGTSGGGVFEANDNAFAGIHQSRINSTIQVRAVSAKKIRDKLYELGYEPVDTYESPNTDDSNDANLLSSDLLLPSTSPVESVPDIKIWLEIASNAISHVSSHVSHNRVEFLSKIEQLFKGDLNVPAVINLDKYRKAKAANMLNVIARELTGKCFSLERTTELFSKAGLQDPAVKNSKEILKEIEVAINHTQSLFEALGGYQDKVPKYKGCFGKASDAVRTLEDVINEIYNKGASGYHRGNTRQSLIRLHDCIKLCSDLLQGVEL